MTKYINLDPHPDERENWKKSGYFPDSPSINWSQSQMLQQIGKGKVINLHDPLNDHDFPFCAYTEEDPERPIKRLVTRFYRTKDSLYFIQTLKGQNFEGSKRRDLTQIVGKYKFSQFFGLRNRETGIVTTTGERDIIDKYDIPFPGTGEFIDPSTGETTTVAALPRSELCSFYLIPANKKPLLLRVTLEQFLTKSYDDWLCLGKNKNVWPPTEPTPAEIAAKRIPKSE